MGVVKLKHKWVWWNWHINGLKCNINGYDFSKISCVETEFGLDKPVNAELHLQNKTICKTIKKNWESKKTNGNMKSVFEKYVSRKLWSCTT